MTTGRLHEDSNTIAFPRSREVHVRPASPLLKDVAETKIQAALQAEPARCIVGDCPAIHKIFDFVRKFGQSEAPVLITGETGTGKELIAAAIHARSSRAAGPFRTVNCAAIPPTLIASELFGYEKGAFTGAVTRKQGIIQAAQGGTLFLDEIGNLPLDLQGYLLRVLQEKTIQMVGGVAPIPVDTRIISATNVDFRSLIKTGQFRSDLFFRLKVLAIHSPPLRERGDDILVLALYFLRKFSAEHGRPELNFTPEAERKLMNHAWPGNVRELMSAIQYAVVVCETDLIKADDLDLTDLDSPPSPLGTAPGGTAWGSDSGVESPNSSAPASLNVPPTHQVAPKLPRKTLHDAGTIKPLVLSRHKKIDPEEERRQVIEAIGYCNGNLAKAALVLRISRMTMYRLMHQYEIDTEVAGIRLKARLDRFNQ